MCRDGGYEKGIEGFSLPCKLEGLYSVLNTMNIDDLMTKSDDKRGFHLLKVAKESRLLTAFEHEGRNFGFIGGPFGSTKLPASFQRANLVTANYHRTLGGRNNLYLDDRLALDNNDTLLNNVPRNGWSLAALVVSAGGFISLSKSDFKPKKLQEFLGLNLDTEKAEISVPEYKWKAFKELINRLIKDKKCSFYEIQKARGKAVAFILCNPLTKLFIREMNRFIAQANKQNLRNSDILVLDDELISELKEWVKLDFLKMKNNFLPQNLDGLHHKLSFTDASSFSASAVVFTESDDCLISQWFFDEDIQQEPIYVKEALAIYWMLEKYPDEFRSKQIIHFCDNQNVVFAYKGLGSKTRKLQAIIKLIYFKLNDLDAKLTMYWVNTHDMIADGPSRVVDWNQEFIPKSIFNKLCLNLNIRPTVDVFASKANAKCEKWVNFGLTGEDNCIGFDFFSMNPLNLTNEFLWVFPPKNIVNLAATHLTRYYSNTDFAFLFHSFGEWPIGIASLIQMGGIVYDIPNAPISIVPAEFQLHFEDQLFYGVWNSKIKATKILIYKKSRV